MMLIVLASNLIGHAGHIGLQQFAVAANSVMVVNSNGDAEDADIADGVCRTFAGTCTLRAALAEAGAQPEANRIEFDIVGTGPHSITISSSLPTLDDRSGGTTIDGYSQPGARVNRAQSVSDALIAIQLVGPRSVSADERLNALQISSGDNRVRGLAFVRMKRSIWISGPSAEGNVIAGCFIGTGADGRPWYDEIDEREHRGGDPGAFGILLSTGAHDNSIGGVKRADRNVISGNANDGIAMRGSGTRANTIVNNLIGLSPDGAARVRNWGDGIDLNYGSASNRIGGGHVGERNVISGNAGEGIEISHGTSTAYNVVAGNYIGVDSDGGGSDPRVHRNAGFGISLEDDVTHNRIGPDNVIANNGKGGIEIYGAENASNHIFGNRIGVALDEQPLPNGGDGVRVRFGASSQLIGPGNIIANNSGAGVLVTGDDVDRVVVTRNVITDNGGLAIDIDPPGVNGSDRNRHDGPNQRLNAPILARANGSSVSGIACPACTVEVYRSSDGDVAGDGAELLGVAVADADGVFTVAVEDEVVGVTLSALAIDPTGNTSEFSAPVEAPFGKGEPHVNVVPGRVEAENYAPGAARTAFVDSTEGNQGGAYRHDDVDIKPCGADTARYGCYVVGWLRDGELLEYDIWVDAAGEYMITAVVASPFLNRAIDVTVDGVPAGRIDVPETGSFQRWNTAQGDRMMLDAGAHRVRVTIVGGGFLLDAIAFEQT